MFHKFAWPLLLLALCCGGVNAQDFGSSQINNSGTAISLIPSTFRQNESADKIADTIRKEAIKQFRKLQKQNQPAPKAQADVCRHCGDTIEESRKHCSAQHHNALCEPAEVTERCSECGRTREQVAKYGHNHKPGYSWIKGYAPAQKAYTIQTTQETKQTTSRKVVANRKENNSHDAVITSDSAQAKKPYF